MKCRPDGALGVSEPLQTTERNRNATESRQAILSTNSQPPETQTSTSSQNRCELEGSTKNSNEHSLVEPLSNGRLFPSLSSNMLVTRPLPSINSPRVGDTDASERGARKKIQKEKTMDIQLRKHKQNLRENIA
ncbi:hypothetical protein I7I53_08671 [Histoplasma capsulatum var. duboisii H88]|uniref:Uncharacterized protein n=1 Tax=Ajellomyces capsulatus (strain H88) TaxID=544711 RepID=A0A8A1LJT3_AJEC8|nr:hypothetical protein I7I53_08671 [Histoplasma capsulatum var. duboisii H88]